MSYQPTSREIARTHIYGKWAGYKGNPYDEKRCACHIMTGGRGSLPTQCRGTPGHGPDGIYCKVHALENFPEPVGTWYKAETGYRDEINPVQVAAFSDKTVTVMTGTTSRRVNVRGDDYHYFPSFEQAKAWLLARLEKRLQRAESDVNEYRKSLESVKSLTSPSIT
jgi:hypothetical protein